MIASESDSRLVWFGQYLIIASAFIPGACAAGIFPEWNVFSTITRIINYRQSII